MRAGPGQTTTKTGPSPTRKPILHPSPNKHICNRSTSRPWSSNIIRQQRDGRDWHQSRMANSRGGMVASLADGSETSIGHCVTGRVEIQGDEIKQKFLVMDMLGHHMLLGMDILKRLDLQMYLNGKLLSAKLDSNQPDICALSPPIGLQELTPAEKQKLTELIDRQKQRFELVEGVSELTKHEIRLKDSTPLKQRYRLRNPAMQAIIDTEVQKML